MTREEALQRISNERDRQMVQWGGHMHDAGHTPDDWVLLLSKHVGKLADLALEGAPRESWLHRLEIIGALSVSAMEVEP